VNILASPTPAAWVDAACEHWRALLLDHANCEKKAASSALALMFAYPEDQDLSSALSRLAREELRHFEQVAQLMRRLHVDLQRQRPGRYAGALRAALRRDEPGRKLDLLLAAALIEARSCERFALLAPRLPPPLGAFYASLQQAEARHFELYLRLAHRGVGDDAAPLVQSRLAVLAAVEAELIGAADEQLRFHSGPPVALRPQPLAPSVAAASLRRTAVAGSAAAPRA
jgi:tRNA-(ms[2]io[6]A)-hydroxylase